MIDSFVYHAIGGRKWSEPGSTSSSAGETYENVLLDYLNQNSMRGILNLTAPGSGENISTETSLECLRKVVNYITK